MKVLKPIHTVCIVESDSWSGQKIIERKPYKVLAAAQRFIAKHNAQNTAARVPDYYTFACFERDLPYR